MVVLAAKIAGEGDLMARFNELKERLGKEGLFDRERKRSLPFLPHRIGIVTSPSGAVIHDMCTVLTRRFPNVEVRLYPVKVQGPGAKEEIVDGIRFFNKPSADWVPDIHIVGRGGGSIEDLWAFNEECVVRAVAESGIPTISAVGHETDFTLCDFAADVRAGTPSIAAEMAVPVKAELVEQVNGLADRLRRAPERAGEVFAQRVDHLTIRLSAALRNAATTAETRLSRSSQRLAPALKESVALAERRLSGMDQRILPALNAFIAAIERRLVAASSKLDLLDPNNPLKRGYSLTFDGSGAIVRSASGAGTGDLLTTRFADGEITSRVC
jgi:exodeoxyribonuclease VII large subunit